MFAITHFKKLSAHKQPVLQLYRRILRHAKHLPKELSPIVVRGAHEAFSINKKIMTPHAARTQIEYGYFWEKILREACKAKDKESIHLIDTHIEKHLAGIEQKGPKVDFLWWKSQNLYGAPVDIVRKYDSKIQDELPDAALIKMENKLATFRSRAIRALHRRGLSSPKTQIDNLYVDIFVAPQLRMFRFRRMNEWRRERETRVRTTRMHTLKTPLGPMARLFVPGQGRRTNHLLAVRMRHALLDDTETKLENIDSMIELAEHEATWEKLALNSDETVKNLEKKWSAPLKEYRNNLQAKQSKARSANYRHRANLAAKKIYLDNILIGSARHKQEKWANYKEPILHKIQYDVITYRGKGLYN